MVLERLDNVKVRSLTLRETILSVKLELSSDNRVLAPTVHVKGSLSKNECSSIRETRGSRGNTVRSERSLRAGSIEPLVSSRCKTRDINGTRHLEKTRSVDESVSTRGLIKTTEGMDGVRERINGISVVERLGTKGLEKNLVSLERRAIVNVGIRLDNPDELLNRVVEVELDLVAG
jgi:hypothetical protein